jgi:hypothetical protein
MCERPDNVKFACICLNASPVEPSCRATRELSAEFRLERPWTGLDLDAWKPDLGRLQLNEIKKATVWVWTFVQSTRLDVCDGENNALTDRLTAFYVGLMLNRPPNVWSARTMTGHLQGGSVTIQSQAQRYRIFHKEHDAAPELTESALAAAATSAGHLRAAKSSSALGGRLERGLVSFENAMYSEYLDESIISLVRSIEAILQPNDKKQFVKRTCAIMDHQTEASHMDQCSAVFEELYDIRSGLVHAEAIEDIFGGVSGEQAAMRAKRLQAIAYLVASNLYRSILAQPELVEKFAHERLGDYWGRVVCDKEPPPFRLQLDAECWSGARRAG